MRIIWASQVVLVVKNPPANAGKHETQVRSLGREDPLEEGMATHSSILAWRISWTEEPGGLQSRVSQRVRHNSSDLARTHMHVTKHQLLVSVQFAVTVAWEPDGAVRWWWCNQITDSTASQPGFQVWSSCDQPCDTSFLCPSVYDQPAYLVGCCVGMLATAWLIMGALWPFLPLTKPLCPPWDLTDYLFLDRLLCCHSWEFYGGRGSVEKAKCFTLSVQGTGIKPKPKCGPCGSLSSCPWLCVFPRASLRQEHHKCSRCL